MSPRPSWLVSASSARIGAATLAILAMVTVALAQAPWYKSYQDGESDFNAGKYEVAEREFLDSMARAPTKDRGPAVLLVSQQRGFIPEYYLALICAKTDRPEQALDYGKTAEGYLKPGNNLTTLKSAEDDARRTIAQRPVPPPPPGPKPGAGDGPPADPFAEAAAQIRTAVSAGHLDDARNLRDQAKAKGAKGSAFDDASRLLDQASVDADVKAAEQALAAGRFADAHAAVARARPLGLDRAKLDQLDADIGTKERVAATGVTFEGLLTQAAAALARNAFAEARGDAQQAHDLGVDNPRVDKFIRQVDSSERALTALSAVEREREGMQDFFAGRYQAAISVLATLEQSGLPRAQLYLASAEAALSMLEPDATKRSQLEASARRAWAQVAAGRTDFAPDLAYLSPGIAKILGISSR